MRAKKKLKRIAAAGCLLIIFAARNVFGMEATELPQSRIILEETSVNGNPARLLAKGMQYRTFDPKSDPVGHFIPNTFLGTEEYRIESASVPKIVGQESVPCSGGIYISEPFTGDGKERQPEETREIDGVQMKLISARLIDTVTEERTEETSVSFEYEALEDGTEIPGVREVEFTDEDTGNVFSAELSLVSSEVTARYWSDNFEFPIHIEQADADSFELGNITVEKDESLLKYADEFLHLLNLDSSCYEITKIEWIGETYPDQAGVLCRDAKASGRKYLQNMTAVYGGTVTYLGIPAKAWECEYIEIVPEERSVIYTMSTDVTLVRAAFPEKTVGEQENGEQPSGIRGRIRAAYENARRVVGRVLEIILDHPAESVICLVVSAAFVVFLLLTGSKQSCIYQPKMKCPYYRHSEEKCRTCVHRYQEMQPGKGNFKPKKTENREW